MLTYLTRLGDLPLYFMNVRIATSSSQDEDKELESSKESLNLQLINSLYET